MRVLYLPLNSPEITQTGMYDGFIKAGAELKVFDFNRAVEVGHSLQKKFINTALDFKPDLIHMQLQFTNKILVSSILEIKKQLPNVIITNWTGDVRATPQDSFINMAKVVDISLVSSYGQVQLYKEASGGCDIRYWQIGYDPKKYYPLYNKSFDWDISFAASNHVSAGFPGAKDRKEAVKVLKKAFRSRFGLFGLGWGSGVPYMQQEKMNKIYNNSISCLSISNFNDLSHYFSDRLLMCMASGRPTISLAFPGWESYFTNNIDIIIVNSVDEIPSKVDWLIDNPDIANSIGKAGYEKVNAEHTYYNRVKELLYMVGELK